MKERSIAFLSWLWRFIGAIWSLLIIGAVAGILGNIGFAYWTMKTLTFNDLRTLTLISWLSDHPFPVLLVFLVLLALTLCAYRAHRYQQHIQQQEHRAHDDALVTIAQGVHTALKELKQKDRSSLPKPSSPPSPTPRNQETLPIATLWNIPYARNPFFTGREELLKQLHDHLTQSTTAALTQPPAITGLGGVGKTQIAIEYAYRYRAEYRYGLWVNAASSETLIEGFVTLVRLLALPEKDEQDQNFVVEAAKQWLSTHEHWLLILDNADDLTLASVFLPTTHQGHLLLTTRASATGSIATSFPVETMDETEGTLLLLRRAKVLTTTDTSLIQVSDDARETASAIVKEMGGLPLALDQAGAYIEETHSTLEEYLKEYRRRRVILLAERGADQRFHPEPVATTWSLNFEQVKQHSPAAADILRFLAFLAPDAIPEALILSGASELGTTLQALAEDETRLNSLMKTLGRFSLVQRNPDSHLLTVHRLVQAIIKANMTKKMQRIWAERTVRAVNRAFPDVTDYRNWPRCQQYLPHAQACAIWIDEWQLAFPEAGSLLNKVAYYLDDHAQYAEAEPLYQRAVAIMTKTLGPANPQTKIVCANYNEMVATMKRNKK